MKLTLVILYALAYLNVSLCAEILCIFPRPAYSHQAVFRAVTEKLLARGHKLTLMTTHPSESEKSHENVTLVDVSFSVEVFRKALDEVYESKSFLDAIYRMVDSESLLIDQQLSSDGMQKLIKNREKKFDLLLIETCGMSPFHALAEHFKVPVVGITSADAFSVGHEIMGNVANPISHPDRVLPFTVAETFKQRLVSCAFNLFMKFMLFPRAEKNNEPIVRKHFPEVTKSYHELVSNVDLQLINAHPALGYLRPILPNTIPLGFLHIKPSQPLPSELQDLLDNSKHGVIFMSFGTVVTQKLAGKNIDNFMKAFAELPFDVFWKIDEDSTFESVPANVHLKKWFPQSDLLAHPNVKLFITHGGQHSVEESIMRHVPMLVCPFHGDQEANAKRAERKGISKTLNIHEKLDPERIKAAISAVIDGASFKINIAKIARLVDDVPMSSADRAVWHIEFVLRHGGADHLKYDQRNISFVQFHFIDLFLSAAGLIFVALLLIYACVRVMWKVVKRLMNWKSKKD